MPPTGPHLKAAVLCEKVIEDKRGVLSLIGIVDRFTQTAIGPGAPNEMPTLKVSASAVIMLVSDEAQGRHDVQLSIRKPSGISQELGSASVLFEGQDRGANLVVQLELVLEGEGLHWIEVRLDDEELLTRMPLRVVYGRMATARLEPPPA